MELANDKDQIYAYLKDNEYMALATSSSDGKPELATVGYVLDGDTLLINTYTRYRKYKNLTTNPQVACVVTTSHDMTLQIDGKAEKLEGREAEDVKQKMLEAQPDFIHFITDSDARFFRITPTWMRLRDYTKEPMQTIEYIPGA